MPTRTHRAEEKGHVIHVIIIHGSGMLQDAKPIHQSVEYLEWLLHGTKATAVLRACTRPLERHAAVLRFLSEESKRPSLPLPPVATPLAAATGDTKGKTYTTTRDGFYFFATTPITESADFKYTIIDASVFKGSTREPQALSPSEAYLAGRAVAQLHAGISCPQWLDALDVVRSLGVSGVDDREASSLLC